MRGFERESRGGHWNSHWLPHRQSPVVRNFGGERDVGGVPQRGGEEGDWIDGGKRCDKVFKVRTGLREDSGIRMGAASDSGMRGLGIHLGGIVMTGISIQVRISLTQGRLGGTTATVTRDLGQRLIGTAGMVAGAIDCPGQQGGSRCSISHAGQQGTAQNGPRWGTAISSSG